MTKKLSDKEIERQKTQKDRNDRETDKNDKTDRQTIKYKHRETKIL